MKRCILFIICCVAIGQLSARTMLEEIRVNPEKAGGVYYAYPVTESVNTRPPKGYEPFYISHYARHGSRYLIDDNDYKWIIDLMHKAREAGALSPLGEDLTSRLDSVWDEAQGRGGALTPLGQRQHNEIGSRMYLAFPEVFAPGAQIHASSTTVLRCSLSMSACCEGIKNHASYLEIPRESSERHMGYLNFHDARSMGFTSPNAGWRESYRKFDRSHTDGTRFASAIFADKKFLYRNVNADNFLRGMFWVAVDMQNMESSVNFFDLFTAEELYDQWQCSNLHFYICDSNYAESNGWLLDNAKPLIRNILATAQEYIDGKKHGATLRFGHDGNIIPLTGKLGFPGCSNSVSDFDSVPDAFRVHEISPMAANVQIVFFRNAKTDDVIVKFMHNERETSIPIETDIYPFYHWKDVKAYCTHITEGEPLAL